MIEKIIESSWGLPAILFSVVFTSLLMTMAPTVYTLDSAELALGAKTLGIVHAPGYPLYLTIAHLFTYLPFNDVAYRVNLFSALSLALTAPVLYSMLLMLIGDRWIAATSALVFTWCYYGWANGLMAEVYAPQLLTISVLGWLLVLLRCREEELPRQGLTVFIGIWYGITVAMAPMSIFFAVGVAATLLLLRTPWKTTVLAGVLSVLVFSVTLLYFPIRYRSDPAFNVAGTYDPAGNFRPLNLETPAGVWRVIRGEQFAPLFFAEGYIPSVSQTIDFLGWFINNFLAIGVIVGLAGIYSLYEKEKRLLFVWLCFLLPYTYFFLTYGADDVKTMFSPTYLVWMVAFAYGLRWTLEGQSLLFKRFISLGLIGLFLVVSFPLVNVSNDTGIYDDAEATLAYLPQGSLVFGQWLDIVPLQYMQQIEAFRRDVTLYNIGLFQPAPYFPRFEVQKRPLFVLDEKSVRVYTNLEQYNVIEHTVGNRTIYELQPKSSQ